MKTEKVEWYRSPWKIQFYVPEVEITARGFRFDLPFALRAAWERTWIGGGFIVAGFGIGVAYERSQDA